MERGGEGKGAPIQRRELKAGCGLRSEAVEELALCQITIKRGRGETKKKKQTRTVNAGKGEEKRGQRSP